MEILHSDKHFVVIVKPVGTDAEHDVPAALQELLGGEFYTLHRLDQNVGGVMVYARTKFAAAELSKAIQNGQMVKEYIARVHGAPPDSGDWQDFLWKDSAKNKVFAVKRERKGVKKARLEFIRLTQEPATLRIRLHTGRSHQIRVQFASRGFPLMGDRKYGGKDDLTAPMLFSCCISFPWKNELLRFEKMPDWL